MKKLSTTIVGIFMLTNIQTAIMLDIREKPNQIKSTDLGPIMRDAIFDLVFRSPPLIAINKDLTMRLTASGRKALSK